MGGSFVLFLLGWVGCGVGVGGFMRIFLSGSMEHGLKVWICFLFIVCFQHNIRFECFFGFKVWKVGGGSSPLVFFDGEVI